MSQPHWRKVPWVLLSCLCSCLLWPMVLGTHHTSTISEVSTKITSTDATSRDRSTQRISTPVTSGASGPSMANEQSVVEISSKSTQNSPASSQTTQAQSQETTRPETEPTTSTHSSSSTGHTPTEAPSPNTQDITTPSSSTTGDTLTETVSPGTSPQSKMTTSSPSSVSNTPSTTSQVFTTTAFTDSTLGISGDTLSPQVSRSVTPVTMGVSTTPESSGLPTGPTPTISTPESTTFSQNNQTQSLETTSQSQMTTLTPIVTYSLSSFTNGHTVAQTTLQDTSTTGNITTPSSSGVTNTPSARSGPFTMTSRTDSTTGNTEDSLPPNAPGSLTSVTTGVSTTPVSDELSTVPTSSTSTQEPSSPSHNTQTQSSLSQMGTLLETSTPPPFSSTTGDTLTETVSPGTSPQGGMTSSSPSSVSNTHSTTSEVFTMTASTDSTLGISGDTPPPPQVSRTVTPVTMGVSTTSESSGQPIRPTPTISTQESTTFSQNNQTQSLETTSQSQMTTLTPIVTYSLSSFTNGHTVTQTTLQDTSTTGNITIASSSGIINTSSATSGPFAMTSHTDSTTGNTEDSLPPNAPGSLTSVTMEVSTTPVSHELSTVPISSASTQEPSSPSHNTQTQSSLSQMGTLLETSTPPPSSSTTGDTLTETVSPGTSPQGEMTTSSPSSVSNTPSTTSEVFTMTASTASTLEISGDTPPPPQVSRSVTPVTMGVSTTSESSGLPTGPTPTISTPESTTFSQNNKTQSLETTSQSQMTTLTPIVTYSLSSFTNGHTVAQTTLQDTSTTGNITTPSSSGVTNTPSARSGPFTMTSRTDSTTGNTEDSLPPNARGSLTSVTMEVSTTPVSHELSTVPISSTSTQEPSSPSHNTQTQSSLSQMGTLLETSTPPPFSSTTGDTLTETVSPGTSPQGGMTSSSPSSVSNTHSTTSEVFTMTASTDSTLGISGDTPPPPQVSRTVTPVTMGVSTTPESSGLPSGPTTTISTQESTTFSQNNQTQSLETTSQSQMTTLTPIVTYSLSSFTNGHTVAQTTLQHTSTTGNITTPSSSGVTNTPSARSGPFTMTSRTDSTTGNTEDSLPPNAPGSLTSVTMEVSTTPVSHELSTVPISSTSTQEPSSPSHNTQTQSSLSQMGTLLETSTPPPFSSTTGDTLTETVSPGTSPQGEMTSSSPSSVTNTPSTTSEVFTMTASTASTLGISGDTPPPPQVSRTVTPVTMGVSTTSESSGLPTGPTPTISTPESTTFSQNNQTQSLETTSQSQMTTLTPIVTYSLSSFTNGHTVTQTTLQDTSTTGNITIASSSGIINTSSATSGPFAMTSHTDSTTGNTEDSLPPNAPGSLTSVTMEVSTTPVSHELSTVPISSTSTQEPSSPSHNTQTQSSLSQMGTLLETSTPPPSSSTTGDTLTETVSPGTSPQGEMTTSSPSSVSNTPSTTSEVFTMTASTASTLGISGDTPPPPQVSRSVTPVTMGVSTTPESSGLPSGPTPTISTPESTTFSQNNQTQSLETTSQSQMTTLTPIVTYSLSSFTNGYTVTQTTLQDTSTTGNIPTPSSSGITNTSSATSGPFTMTSRTDSTTGNTEDSLPPNAPGSLTSVTMEVSTTPVSHELSTVPISSTSTQETPSLSHNSQTESSLSQMGTLLETSTPPPSSSTTGDTLTETVSPGTSPQGEMTSSSPSSVSNTPSTTSEVFTMTASTASTLGISGDTPPPPQVSRGVTPVTMGVSTTSESSGQPTRPTPTISTPESTTFSQNNQTQSLETTSQSQMTTLTPIVTYSLSSFTNGYTVTQTTLQDTSTTGNIPTPSSSGITNTSSATSGPFTMTSRTDSTTGNTEDSLPPNAPGSLTSVTMEVSATPVSHELSTLPIFSTSTQEPSSPSHNTQTQSSLSQMGTLLETSTPPLSSSTTGDTLTETVSPGTSPQGEMTSSSPSSVSNTPSTTSEVFTMTASTDSTLGISGDIPPPPQVSRSVTPVTMGVSRTLVSSGQPIRQIPITSTQESASFSQNTMPQGPEPTRQAQLSTSTEVANSAPSSSPSGQTLTETVSYGTSPPAETATSPLSSTSNTMTISTDFTPANTGDTSSPQAAGSPTPVTSGLSTTPVSNTVSTPETPNSSTQYSSSSSQNSSTGVTSSMRLSSTSGHALTETIFQETSTTRNITTPVPSSVTNTPSVTTDLRTMTSHTGSTPGNTWETSSPHAPGGSVTTGVSTAPESSGLPTGPTPTISTRELTAFSQNTQTQSSPSPMSTLPKTTTAPPSSSTTGDTLTETVSPGTSPQGEMTTSSPSSVTNTPSTTSEVFTMTASTASTLGISGDTPPPPQVSRSVTPVTMGVSTTPESSGLPTGPTPTISTQESTTFSQNNQTQSLETTYQSQMTTLTPIVTYSLSSFTNGHTVTQTTLQDTSTTGNITTPSSSGITNTSSAMSGPFTMTSHTDSTTGNTEDSLPPNAPGSLTSVTMEVSTTPVSHELSTVPISSTSTQEPSSPSHNTQTQSSLLQMGTLLERTNPPLSFSTTGDTLTETVSPGTSPQGEMTTSSPSSVSNTPSTTSEVFTMTASTDSTLGSSGDTPPPPQVSRSVTPVTMGVSTTSESSGQPTRPTPTISTQELTVFSQNTQTQSSPSQMSTLPKTTTAPPSSSTTGDTLTETVSPGTSPQGEMTTSSPSSVTNTPSTTSEVFTTTASTDSTLGISGDTPPPPQVSGSVTPVTMGVSRTPVSRGLLTGSSSMESSTAFSQITPIPTMETTSQSQMSTLRKVTTSSVSSARGHTRAETVSQRPAFPGVVTSSLGPHRTSAPSTSPPTLPASTPSMSTSSLSTAPPRPTPLLGGIPLFPYGSSAGDLWLPSRGVDVTSRLFKLQIGFPFGSSLRDSLYFTDDGQIIFPESDYHIFSYPNPPSQGFTRWDSVAMVAPFWDVADFSSQKGTIFYQEYETLYGEYDLLVRQVETWIQQFTNSRDYYAKWTLKITWVKVPAYPAQSTLGTNTYQAILTTDGSRSYALFLYQRGGMQWDVTQRLYSSVVIGFSSGDGHFENSPLMFQPVWKKYRPDQFLHPKLGLYGVQIYRLHREERPNFRLKCLEWLKSQPQWPSWGWSHISCPCSWQQGRWDFRFQPIHTGWWDSNSRKLCSFSSWRGGVCCSYGPWGEFREGWHVRSPWHFDQDLEPQNWCCHWNDKPFLCEQYWQRRGRISCAGYRPPRPAWTFGDPHIVTFDDANYTFNGLGDFVLARAWDGNSSFLLQGRTAQTSSANATNFIAFAAQYNSSTLGPITVQWLLDSNNTIQVLHNHHNVTFETNHVDAEGLHIFNTTGLLLTRNGSQVSASFDGTVTITVVALSNILHASSSLPEEYQNHTEGLLGVWNNNPEDDFKMPNGSTIPRNSSEKMLYHYGMTWQTNGTDLLGKRTDSLPSNFTPVFLSQLSMRNNMSLASECNENIPCIYDTLITGNTDTGRHTRMASENYRQMNASLNQKPPSINGPRRIEAYKEKTKKIQFSSNSENITFTLRDQCSDFKLFENGTFLWTPTSLRPCTVEILARDSRTGLTSALQLQAVVCFCNAESQCFFNQTRWVDNSFLEVASCKCDGDSFGLSCEHTKDPCDQQCFPNVRCVRGKGCEACPPNMTGDGRHCAALEDLFHCANHSCPVNYCYNQGHCYISRTPDCQPSCICPPAFTDNQCFLAGNSFTPAVYGDLPLRVIHLTLREGDNASAADVNASVAYRLETLEVRAFLRNSQVQSISQSILAPGRTIQHWLVTSEFQYRAKGPVIHFLNNQLREAIVELFLQAPRGRHKRNEEPKNNVFFYPISKEDVHDGIAVNLSTLETYFKCDGYKGYRLVYDPQRGFTCVSPCGENYCHHGGQCQHLPDGPRCSCLSFSIYTSWGERCERLSVKLGAFLGILFGALGALSLLGVGVGLCCWGRIPAKNSYPLFPES